MEEKKYIKRKEKASADGNRELLAQACTHLGDFYNKQGRYQDAVKEYGEEAKIYAKIGKKLEMAIAHRMMGEMFMLLSDFESARENIETYLKIVKKLQNKVEEQRAYATLGRSHLLNGQALSESSAANAMNELRQAEKAFLKSLLLTKELTGQISKVEQHDMQARCYLNIGVVKEHMADFKESIAYIERAIKISKSNDIFELTHTCYVSLSLQLNKNNDATAALRFCNQALDVAKRFTDKVKKICETLIIKSEILIRAGDFASAKQILTKAYKKNTPDESDRAAIEKNLRIVVKISEVLDELVTTSSVDYVKRKELYEKLGDCCCHLPNYPKALEYYKKMLECAQLNNESGKSLIPIYVSLYQTYKDNKQYDEALEFLWKEYHLNKDVPKEAVSTLCGIAEICELQMQSYWTIQDVYLKAKDHAANAGDARHKLEKIVYVRLWKLQIKHKMNIIADELVQEADSKGIDIKAIDEDSDTESENVICENNTPDLGEDVCLEDLTDSDTSDLDETDKPRPYRPTRGTRSLTIKRNNKGETQLHQACISGNIELVRRLIDQGHVVNVRDHAGWLPLHEACNHGFRDIVELLLERGAVVAINDKGGTSCDGITPLYDACSNGFLDVVELLLEKGADTTLKTDFGDTCLSALDKWRGENTITEGEQAQYEQLRGRLIKTLSKSGICSSQNSKPLTNKNTSVRRSGSTYSRKQRGCDTVVDSNDGTEDEEENLLPRTTRLNRSNEKPKSSASAVYKSAIDQLKRPLHRPPSFDMDEEGYFPSSSNVVKQKRTAYLEDEDVDDDHWLVDDLGPEKKKRRLTTTPTKSVRSTAASTHHKSPSRSHSQQHSFDSGISTWLRDSLSPENDAFQVLLDSATATTSQQRQKQARKLSLSRTSSMSTNASQRQKAKQQASLLDSGFCRFRSESPRLSSEDSSDMVTALNMPTAEPDSTTTSVHLLISPNKSSPIPVQTSQFSLTTSVSFKVKIEDEMLLVPVERKKLNDINIRWLADEAARRYYNLVGLKPLLRLKTADGFAYEENDSVSVALEQNMIMATVIEWQISPLGQRYEEMCVKHNRDVNNDVLSVMQRAEISNSIQLNDFWLNSLKTETVFKAVLHQTNLRTLDLSNNFLQNDGCRQLAKAMPTLKNLRSLNVSGNFITSDGLDILLSSIGNSTAIEELILSRNPLGNTALRYIDRFCNNPTTKSLHKLHLAHCNLTQLYDFDLCYNEILDFDISFNQLADDAIRMLLTKLNSCRLQNFNFSCVKLQHGDERPAAAGSSPLAQRLVEFFESGTCEKFKRIALAGCQLADVDIYKISQCLSRAMDLEQLDISLNERLTSSSMHFILDKIPHLKKLLATNSPRFLDVDKMEQITQMPHIPNFVSLTLVEDHNVNAIQQALAQLWLTHWGDRGKSKKFNGNCILYINDKDLNDIF